MKFNISLALQKLKKKKLKEKGDVQSEVCLQSSFHVLQVSKVICFLSLTTLSGGRFDISSHHVLSWKF